MSIKCRKMVGVQQRAVRVTSESPDVLSILSLVYLTVDKKCKNLESPLV